MDHRSFFGFSARSAVAFDTVWLLALSLNASLEDAETMQQMDTLLKNNLWKYFLLIEELRKRMISMDFEGMSVSICMFSTGIGRPLSTSSSRLAPAKYFANDVIFIF